MRILTALKLIVTLLVVTLLVVFFLQNRGPARILFPFGRSIHFGLIYMLLISYAMGVISTAVVFITINTKISKRRKAEESEDLVEDE